MVDRVQHNVWKMTKNHRHQRSHDSSLCLALLHAAFWDTMCTFTVLQYLHRAGKLIYTFI